MTRRLICLDFGYCSSQKIKTWVFFIQKPVFNPFLTQNNYKTRSGKKTRKKKTEKPNREKKTD